MSKIAQIDAVLQGQHYVCDNPLTAYCAARRVRNALRIQNPARRLSTIREALNAFRVTSWLTSEGRIELRRDGQPILTL